MPCRLAADPRPARPYHAQPRLDDEQTPQVAGSPAAAEAFRDDTLDLVGRDPAALDELATANEVDDLGAAGLSQARCGTSKPTLSRRPATSLGSRSAIARRRTALVTPRSTRRRSGRRMASSTRRTSRNGTRASIPNAMLLRSSYRSSAGRPPAASRVPEAGGRGMSRARGVTSAHRGLVLPADPCTRSPKRPPDARRDGLDSGARQGRMERPSTGAASASRARDAPAPAARAPRPADAAENSRPAARTPR